VYSEVLYSELHTIAIVRAQAIFNRSLAIACRFSWARISGANASTEKFHFSTSKLHGQLGTVPPDTPLIEGVGRPHPPSPETPGQVRALALTRGCCFAHAAGRSADHSCRPPPNRVRTISTVALKSSAIHISYSHFDRKL
jgi:hypothetical protein